MLKIGRGREREACKWLFLVETLEHDGDNNDDTDNDDDDDNDDENDHDDGSEKNAWDNGVGDGGIPDLFEGASCSPMLKNNLLYFKSI